jgi:hypothetical protein
MHEQTDGADELAHYDHLAVMKLVAFAILGPLWQELEVLPADQHGKICCGQIAQEAVPFINSTLGEPTSFPITPSFL